MRAALIALLLLTGCAAPNAPQTRATAGPSGASDAARDAGALPSELEPFRRTGEVTNLELLPGGAGLGASARYVPANGERMIATVYLYDRGQFRQPEGGDSPDVMQELRTTTAELNAMARMGRYRSVAFDTGMDVGPIRCANFRIVQPDGATTGDSVCVTVQRGSFVKVRVTSWSPADSTAAGILAAGLTSMVLDARTRGTGS
jgi:hypothetical protein